MATSGSAQPPESPDPLWLRPRRTRRPPQVALSREEIARVALAVADAEGAEAVTMRRIAQDLGFGTMSLYRHVRTKDEVFELMVDTALSEEDRPATASGNWLEDLRKLAVAKRAVLLAHPWLARLVAGRPVLGPQMIASTEFALSTVSPLELSMNERVRLVNTPHAFVNGFVQTELEETAWRRPAEPAGDDTEDWRTALPRPSRRPAATPQRSLRPAQQPRHSHNRRPDRSSPPASPGDARPRRRGCSRLPRQDHHPPAQRDRRDVEPICHWRPHTVTGRLGSTGKWW
ncbi:MULTISPECIES: TetR/AcrR family transcriptional regulator [unclassified Streptomyces]|uniref:TetR/AcrR family transcriptional regulator n=1 Tax=unclassified Streptomyces TaxID=2593676 RepID=UPI000823DCF9|nr:MULTISPECIES: TetR/AcrR family transcriptional regulator [unclassified Streptomyces]SCK58738.1 transcriptional regulator, TetR family [Streptomyces sp. AmelKG-E11A]